MEQEIYNAQAQKLDNDLKTEMYNDLKTEKFIEEQYYFYPHPNESYNLQEHNN
jgi:hypothetical protein